ncbi:MAG: SDR family NAD(P)-dependent oxidoreductase [Tannerellaceae bacterium]|jgi:NAD(P)-dependent dehydrogenase (short-subunit alcohol dehydrogenase family)|nr:SDR family NAD(P)-dependent oxidoreductase [Tannerellaceae bacterium]
MMKEKTFIITGGNSGLGYQCAKNIALENDSNHVIIASRNEAKSAGAARKLVEETNNPHIRAFSLNLASLASIRDFCQAFADTPFPPLYGLVCNAIAGSHGKNEYTEDGFEMTFGVGHLGHFLLANILLTRMPDSGRIVFVSSDQHNPARWMYRISYTDALDLAFPKEYRHIKSYSGVKLCNIYCACEMAKRISAETSKNISVNAFNPAFMADTGLGKANSFAERMAKAIAPVLARMMGLHSSAGKSGKLLASLMTGEKYAGITGKYFDRDRECPSSELSCNTANAENLWKRSIELVGLQQNETLFTL